MPKTANEKSWRKPLSEIHNVSRRSTRSSKKKKEKDGDDSSTDILTRVRSDLSKLITQIDTVTVSANQLKTEGKLGDNEVKSFIEELEKARSCLQPWQSRLHMETSRQEIFSANKSVTCTATNLMPPLVAKEDVLGSPEESKLENSVSPSPLVSWRADWDAETGKQLFLLTPLPISKALSVKGQGVPYTKVEENQASSSDSMAVKHVDPGVVQVDSKRNDNNVQLYKMPSSSFFIKESGIPDSAHWTNVVNAGGVLLSAKSVKTKKRESKRTYLMTPCWKMSPPKTCVLLENISDSSTSDSSLEATRLAIKALQFDESQSSDSSMQDELPQHLQKTLRIIGQVESSPERLLSPPKTCMLMPAGQSSNSEDVDQSVPMKGEVKNIIRQHSVAAVKIPMVECTPMWKSVQTVAETSKAPGEQTLKRELWTRFEAVATGDQGPRVRFVDGLDQPRFLQRLEEE